MQSRVIMKISHQEILINKIKVLISSLQKHAVKVLYAIPL